MSTRPKTVEYADLLPHLQTVRQLNSALALLHWDQQVYMPPAATADRGEQIAVLARLRHEAFTDPKFTDAVEELAAKDTLADDEQVIVRELRRDVQKAVRVAPSLVEAISQAESETHASWLVARRENSFAVAQPSLAKLIDLKRQYGMALGIGAHAYDGLIDLHEPYATADEIATLFDRLRDPLSQLVKKFAPSSRPTELRWRSSFPKALQTQFLREVARAIGFSFEAGRIDETVHPFCSDISSADVRLAVRYDEADVAPAIMTLIHEAGHGLYEQGLPTRYVGTPLAVACSLGIHESQSLIWEKQVGRSREFWSHFFPRLKETCPQAVGDISLEAFYRHLNTVRPSLIRVGADEVTYGLHILIRFELERDLVLEHLSVEDLPEAWNERYRQLLGIAPDDDRTGVLQDIHWFGGSFGYFPTYLLGALYAAQLFRSFADAHPGWEGEFREGRFSSLLDWLREGIHRHGRHFSPRDLVRQATGKELDPAIFLDYLTRKYSDLAP